MSTPDPTPPAVPETPVDGPGASRTVPAPDVKGGARRTARPWSVALSAAALAAATGWLLGESRFLQVKPAIGQYNMMGMTVIDTTHETRQTAEVRTSALVYGAFGALLGLSLGLAGGISAGRAGRAGVAAAVGLVCGGAAGGLMPLVVLPAYLRSVGDGLGEMLPTLAMHSALWAGLGAASGLAYAVGRGARGGLAGAVAGGAVGALIGTTAYELLGAFVFPLAGTVNPIAGTWPTRLLTFLFLALATAAGALIGGPASAPKRIEPAEVA